MSKINTPMGWWPHWVCTLTTPGIHMAVSRTTKNRLKRVSPPGRMNLKSSQSWNTDTRFCFRVNMKCRLFSGFAAPKSHCVILDNAQVFYRSIPWVLSSLVTVHANLRIPFLTKMLARWMQDEKKRDQNCVIVMLGARIFGAVGKRMSRAIHANGE